MGGGSTMRAAARVTSLVNSGLRSGVIPETSLSPATRAVSSPIGAISVNSSLDGVNTTTAIIPQPLESHCSGEFDDWHFIGTDEERRVFSAPPTIEEAKTATGELKDALEMIIVSSPRFSGSLQESGHSSQLSRIEESQDNVSLISDAASAPKHAIQAFRFLDQDPDVQEVVASIASDPNVWDALLQNPALKGYIRSHSAIFKNVHENVGESLIQGDMYYQESSAGDHEEMVKSDNEEMVKHDNLEMVKYDNEEMVKPDNVNTDFKNELHIIWKNIKLGVVDIMTNLSGFFNSLFGVEGDKKDGKSSDAGSSIPHVFEKILGPSMFGVVVLVIMIVVLKRV